MKKIFASILLLVYFTVSTGFVVSVHYCMNKITSVELGAAKSNDCSRCGMYTEKSGGCCSDDVKLVKMQADQSVEKMIVADFAVDLPFNTSIQFLLTPFYNFSPTERSIAHSPPISKQDTYLQNCVFRL